MRRSRIVVVIAAMCLAVGGCPPGSSGTDASGGTGGGGTGGGSGAGTGGGTAGGPGGGTSTITSGVSFDAWPAETEACPGLRWVGEVATSSTPCPTDATGTWTGAKLVPFASMAWVAGAGATTTVQDELDDRREALARYCFYVPTADGVNPPPSTLPGNGGVAGTDWLDRDCHVVTPAAPSPVPIPIKRWPKLRQRFLETLDWVDPPIHPTHLKTWVAVIDDRRNHPGEIDRIDLDPAHPFPLSHPHGQALRQLLVELLCTQAGDCAGTLSSHMALSLRRGTLPDFPIEDEKWGGTFGWQSKVASAVNEALATWRTEAKDSKLVLNLSIGWDPKYDTTPTGGSRNGVRATRVALELAACAGALSIAAAGNDPGGTLPAGGDPPSGPIAPAAWEQVEMPSPCAHWGPTQPALTGPPYRPLVHAVGGVTAEDRLLRVSRDGARPRLVAPAFHAVVGPIWAGVEGGVYVDQPPANKLPSSQKEPVLEPFTGTSVAAATVSGLAAILWHHVPDLTPHEVMSLIYDQSIVLQPPVGDEADFCISGTMPCPATHRVSVCSVLGRALPRGAAPGAPCKRTKPHAAPGPTSWAGAPSGTPVSATAAQLTHTVSVQPCGRDVRVASASAGADQGCADRQHFNGLVAPWRVDPHPGTDPCGICELQLGAMEGEVEFHMHEDVVDDVAPMQLIAETSTGQMVFDISGMNGGASLQPGQVYRMGGFGVGTTHGVTSAEAVFTLTDRHGNSSSARSELEVGPL